MGSLLIVEEVLLIVWWAKNVKHVTWCRLARLGIGRYIYSIESGVWRPQSWRALHRSEYELKVDQSMP